MSSKVIGSILFLLALVVVQTAEAGFSTNGRMQSKNLNLSIGGVLENNGQLIGLDAANLSCDRLTGKGLISAPQITIKAKTFAFTGVIECDGKCTITTSSPFNERMFKKRGNGEFVIIIEESPAKQPLVIHSP